ncbi:unnamed protein product [Leptosia nina]|uniref:Uncharacterized protein n=1 Tax=Leptosia nina TaxID=320188 RepID=A0AAV1K3D9_9NEOP
MPTVSSREPTKRVIAYYYNYRCAYINASVAAIGPFHSCATPYVHICYTHCCLATRTRAEPSNRCAFQLSTPLQRDRLRACRGVYDTRLARLCATTSGQPVHRRPPDLPATRLRTPRRGAVAPAIDRNTALWITLTQIMLSVQVPGCAGMERLGAPGGPRLRHELRHHHSSLEWEKQQRLQAMVGRLQEMVEQESRARSAAAAERLGLPPSIQLPDGEYGQDAHLQLRVPYQQAELTRSSFQPPPNKCVSDVPEWAGAVDTGAGVRRGGGTSGASGPGSKKDGLLQKATRWWVRMGARPPPAFLPAAAPPPCVMVPRRAAPSPPPDA